MVLVENILFKFDAACVLVISPINEGIRYSGREKKKHKKRVKTYVAKWITMAVVDRFSRTPASHPLIISEFVIVIRFSLIIRLWMPDMISESVTHKN